MVTAKSIENNDKRLKNVEYMEFLFVFHLQVISLPHKNTVSYLSVYHYVYVTRSHEIPKTFSIPF